MLVPSTILGRIEQRIRQAGPIDKISSLLLDEIPIKGFTPEIKQLLERCSKLEYLSLDTCSLDSLNLLPALPKLQVLELNHNMLTDEDLQTLGDFPKMRRIFMRENQITKLESLEELAELQDLIQVELNDNPICESQNYRENVYSIVKGLEILDGKDKEGNEMEDLSNSQYTSENSLSEKDMSSIEDSGEGASSSNNADEPEENEDTGRKQRKLNPE